MVGQTSEFSIPDLFVVRLSVRLFITKFLKNFKKAIRPCRVVIAQDPDSTIHGALYGCSHPCFYIIPLQRILKGAKALCLPGFFFISRQYSVQAKSYFDSIFQIFKLFNILKNVDIIFLLSLPKIFSAFTYLKGQLLNRCLQVTASSHRQGCH